MKKIDAKQVQAILDAFYQINAPVQVYSAVQKMLNELPEVEEKKK
jgi:hypothetical protein